MTWREYRTLQIADVQRFIYGNDGKFESISITSLFRLGSYLHTKSGILANFF